MLAHGANNHGPLVRGYLRATPGGRRLWLRRRVLDGAGVKGAKAMPFSEIKSTFPDLKNPANRHKGVSLTPKEFHYSFTHTLTEEESQAAYDRYAAPTPGRILFQGGFANFDHDAATTYDFSDDDRAAPALCFGRE